jgi:hypothetical protein
VNVNAMVVSQLNKRRVTLVAELAGIDAALTAFGGRPATSSAPARTRTRKRRTLSPEHIAKMQAARQASRAAKAVVGPAEGAEDDTSPIEEARAKRAAATADTGHAQVPRRASLVEAAS